MTLKLEFALLGAVMFGAGVFYASQQADADMADKPLPTVSEFTKADFHAFDRDFDIKDQPCAIGIDAENICFTPSPLEADIAEGQVLAPHIPLLPAEFPVVVATDLKAAHLRTARYGRILALVDPKTRRVEDTIRLSAPDYATATADAVIPDS